MKTHSLILLSGSMLAILPVAPGAGDPGGPWQPASSNQPGSEFPQVDADGRVRTRIVAPDAGSVQLDIGAVKYPLAKAGDGAWIGCSEPQDVGFHYYQIVIDGARVPDPGSLYFYGAGRWGSGVEVPAEDEEIYSVKNVPHGRLSETWYHSETSRTERRIFVYTPPQYDRDPSARFPVLYLQHGGGEDQTGWGNQGRAAMIMDNLIAEDKATPFIIVMENGHDVGNADLPEPAEGEDRRRRLFAHFGIIERVIVNDLIPHIDACYRTIADQPHRAMAGLSMGGMQTRSITLKHPDTFGAIGVFSGGSIRPDEIDDMDAFAERVNLVFFSYGSREQRGAAAAKADATALGEAGVNAHYYESPGTGHEWQSWRRSLHQFAQLVFRDVRN